MLHGALGGPSSSSGASPVGAPAETTREREVLQEPEKSEVRRRFRTKTADWSTLYVKSEDSA